MRALGITDSQAGDFVINDMQGQHHKRAIGRTARERMIEDRDPFARILADHDKSERARTWFVRLQNLIEAIERAIKTEQQCAEVATQLPPR